MPQLRTGGTEDQRSRIRDQGSGIRDQGSGIKDQGSRIKDQGSRIRNEVHPWQPLPSELQAFASVARASAKGSNSGHMSLLKHHTHFN